MRVTRPTDDFDVEVSPDGDTVWLEDRSYDPHRETLDVDFPPDESETDRLALGEWDVSVSPLTVSEQLVESEALTEALAGVELD